MCFLGAYFLIGNLYTVFSLNDFDKSDFLGEEENLIFLNFSIPFV